jgi:hypothetical protein
MDKIPTRERTSSFFRKSDIDWGDIRMIFMGVFVVLLLTALFGILGFGIIWALWMIWHPLPLIIMGFIVIPILIFKYTVLGEKTVEFFERLI